MKMSLVTGAVAVVGVVVVAIIIILAIGALLPKHHNVSRTVHVAAAPSDVYATIRNFAALRSWRPDVRSVEMLPPVDGRVRFRETSSNGAVTYEVMDDIPGTLVVTRIVDTNLGYSGAWTYAIAPAANGGTSVTITEDADVTNVFFRFMSRFVFGHTGTIEKYLADLEKKFQESK